MKNPPLKQQEAGGTVVISLFVTLILTGFVALAVDYTGNIGRNAQRDRVFNNAVEIGDGCLELAFGSWRKLSATVENPATDTFNAIPTPSPGDFPSFPQAVIANFDVQAVKPTIELTSQNPPTSSLATTEPPPKTTGPGTGTFSYFYLATVDVTLPHTTGTLTAKVRRVFEKRYTSAWNWAMLYNDDLELHPDSPLTLNGWVHSNKNVYIGNGTINPLSTPAPNLTLTDRLTYAGSYTVGFHPQDGGHLGQLNVADAISPADFPPGTEQVYYPFGWDPTKFNPGHPNYNDEGWREMIERKSEAGASSDPFQNERLYNQANIAILIQADNSIQVYTGTGHNKTLSTSSSGSNLNAKAYNAASASITTGSYIQDNRETASIRTVNFDVDKFMGQIPASVNPADKNYNATKDWNGILYIADVSANSTTKRAVRIRNGAQVPSGGMTIVSDNPVYIQGDFNTGRTSSVEPPSNLGDPTDPEAGSYSRRPASVMADAITLLSNNWNDGNAPDLTNRVATNTTINAALVAGNVRSDGSNYSGGGENFVRFAEDWTGKTFTYYGSMINLFASEQGTGTWGKGNVYQPPQLQWYFDNKLSVDANGEPVRVPGYISTVAYLQQQRWYLQY